MADEFDGEIAEDRRVPARSEPSRREMNLIFASPACEQVFGALAAAQGIMENPRKSRTARVKGRTKAGAEYEYSYAYAPLDEIVNVIRKPLSEAGLIHRQFLAQRGDVWVMRTVIAHASGQWYGCDYPIFWDETKGMQGFASGVTYARRYGLMMALGLVGEDDDDANLADGNIARIAAGRPWTRESSAPLSDSGEGQHRTQRPPKAAAAPSDDKRELALKLWNDISREIARCVTTTEIDEVVTSLEWEEMMKAVKDGVDAETAAASIRRLQERAEEHKNLLRGEG